MTTTHDPAPTTRLGAFSRRRALAGSAGIAAASAAAPLLTGLPPAQAAPVKGERVKSGPATGASDLLPKVRQQHPRFVLGGSVSLDELQARAKRDAYAPFIEKTLSYSDRRAAFPTIGQPGTDTEWQAIYWAVPELVVAWLITKKDEYKTKLRNWVLQVTDEAKHPEWGGESGGSIANSAALIGVSAAYDWAHDVWSDEEKAVIVDKLVRQSLKLEEQFTLNTLGAQAYWKNDWQNNHLLKRVDGLLAAIAVTYGERGAEHLAEDAVRLHRVSNMARQIVTWIAQDGSNHEGPTYFNYGYEHLVRIVDGLEGLTGEDLWTDAIKQIGVFKMHVSLPRLFGQAVFGDADGTQYYFNPYLWRIAAKYRDGRLQDFLHRLYAVAPDSFSYNAWNLLWHDDKLARKPLSGVAPLAYFPDLGYVATRTGWDDDDVSLHVKSGPMGGVRLNQWRDRIAPNRTYVNVAHDHPDAGHWSVSFDGARWGGYAPYGKYLSKYRNVVVAGDDLGQAGETEGWFQPYADMRDRAAVERAVRIGRSSVVHTQAHKAYQAPSKANLEFVERFVLLLEGELVLVLDDVTSAAAQSVHTLFHTVATVAPNGTDSWLLTQPNAAGQTVTAGLVATAVGGGSKTEPSFLPAMGTVVRTTTAASNKAAFVTALRPRAAVGPVEIAATDTTITAAVTGPGAIVEQVILARGEARAVESVGVRATGRLLRVRSKAAQPQSVLLSGGTSVSVGGTTITTERTADILLTKSGSGYQVRIVSDESKTALRVRLKTAAENGGAVRVDGGRRRVSLAGGKSAAVDIPADGAEHVVDLG